MWGKKPSTEAQSLANAPDSAFVRAQREFAELHGSPKVEASRTFVANLFLSAIILALVGLVVALLPLKEIRPYVVEVREGEGVIGRPVETKSYTPTDGMLKQAMAQFAERMWKLNAATSREDYKKAQEWLRGAAIGQFNAFLNQQKPFDRLVNQPLLFRAIEAINIDVSTPNVAFVFFDSVERVGNGTPLRKRHRMTINYTLIAPTSEAELIKNPAGVTITNLDINTEEAR